MLGLDWLDSAYVGNLAAVMLGLLGREGFSAVKYRLGRKDRERAATAAKWERRSAELRIYIERQLLMANETLALRRMGLPSGVLPAAAQAFAQGGTLFRAEMLADDPALKTLIKDHRKLASEINTGAKDADLEALATQMLIVEGAINQRMIELGMVG